jgi:uncharacterized spore protein YtfJ
MYGSTGYLHALLVIENKVMQTLKLEESEEILHLLHEAIEQVVTKIIDSCVPVKLNVTK